VKIEAVADDEFYFSHVKKNKGRKYKFQVFRRFDESCQLDPVVIDGSGLRITASEKTPGGSYLSMCF
jgi:hypothetical protein